MREQGTGKEGWSQGGEGERWEQGGGVNEDQGRLTVVSFIGLFYSIIGII